MKINSGYVDYFYIISSEDIKREVFFYEYLEKMLKDPLRITSEKPNYEVRLTESFQKEICERSTLIRENKEKGIKIPIILEKSIKLPENIVVTPDDQGIQIYDDGYDLLEVLQEESLERFVNILNKEQFYTGVHSKDNKNRFLIRPPEFLLEDKVYIPTIMLSIYKTGEVLLHLSMLVENIDLKIFSGKTWDLPFEEALLPNVLSKNIIKNSSLKEISEIYLKYYRDLFGIENDLVYDLMHLTLIDYPYKPDVFNAKTTRNFNEYIYRILFAPIFKHQLQSDEICNEILMNHVYRYSQHLSLYANYNRLISCFSKNFDKDIQEQLDFFEVKEDLQDYHLSLSEKHSMAIEANLTVIEDVLIEKMKSSIISLTRWDIKMPNWKLLDNQILETERYLLDYYKMFYNFESLSRLKIFILNKCENYLRFEIDNNRKKRIEEILTLRKEKTVYIATIIGPLLTIILTALLSYSSIESIANKISLEELTMLIYIVVNIIFDTFLIMLFRTQFNDVIYFIKKTISNFRLKKIITKAKEIMKYSINKLKDFF